MKYRKLYYALLSLILICLIQNIDAQDDQEYIPKSFEKSYVFHKISKTAIFTFERLDDQNPVPQQGKYEVIQKHNGYHKYSPKIEVVEKKTGKLIYEATIPYLNDLDPKRYGAMKESMVGLVNPYRDDKPCYVNTPDFLFASISGDFSYYYHHKTQKYIILPKHCVKNNKGYNVFSWHNLSDNLLIGDIYLNVDNHEPGRTILGGHIVYDLTTKEFYNVVLSQEMKKQPNIEIKPLDKIQSIVEIIPFTQTEKLDEEGEYLESLGYYKLVKNNVK